MGQAIIGLGNPGPEYRNTRHNVGQRVVDLLARRASADFSREGRHPLAQTTRQGEILYLIKPTCYVNESGPVIARLARGLGLSPADLVVVFDDLDLPLGKVRVRAKGSAGGHNGVRSLIEALGTDAIRRVKVGIGRPAPPGEAKHLIVDHVLSPFFADEQETVAAACAEAADLALTCVDGARVPSDDAN